MARGTNLYTCVILFVKLATVQNCRVSVVVALQQVFLLVCCKNRANSYDDRQVYGWEFKTGGRLQFSCAQHLPQSNDISVKFGFLC